MHGRILPRMSMFESQEGAQSLDCILWYCELFVKDQQWDLLFGVPASAKALECEGSISSSACMGSYHLHVFQPYPPSRWVLLQWNEYVGSSQDFILLSFCLVQTKRIRRQGEHKIPDTNGGKLLRRFSLDFLSSDFSASLDDWANGGYFDGLLHLWWISC